MINRVRSIRDDGKPAHPILMYGCAVVVTGIIVFVIVAGIWGMAQAHSALRIVANTR